MCKKVTCPKCEKPTWAGCGAHIEEVLGDIPVAQRCQCEGSEPPGSTTSGLSSLFRRSR